MVLIGLQFLFFANPYSMSCIGVNQVIFNKNFWEFQKEVRGGLANFTIANSAGKENQSQGRSMGHGYRPPLAMNTFIGEGKLPSLTRTCPQPSM